MKVVRLEIPSGDPGTDATVRIIRQLIESGKRSLKIRSFAEWILKLYEVAARDRVGEIAAIHDWAKKNIRYVQDPHRVEFVQTPERLLVSRTGDCDDFTALVGALAESIGYPVDIKVVAKPGRKEYHHVYPVAVIGAGSVGLDASMPVPLGYESPEISRSKTYKRESKMLDVFGNLSGLGLAPIDIQVERANGGPVVITGGNGTRKIDRPILPADIIDPAKQVPQFVRGVPTAVYLGKKLTIHPGNPLRDYYVRELYERNFFVAAPGSQLTLVDFANGISEVAAMATGNGPVIYPGPPEVLLPETDPDWKPPPIVGPGGERPTYYHPPPTEGAGQFGPVIYLKLGESYSGMDAKRRMDTGNLRPATANLMLVYKPVSQGPAGSQAFWFNPSGTVTAVLRTVNGVVEPTVPGTERVTVPEYDVFGQPTTQPVVVTAAGAPAPGIDTKTMLMIGGAVLALIMLTRK
jgi:hypothetical protein